MSMSTCRPSIGPNRSSKIPGPHIKITQTTRFLFSGYKSDPGPTAPLTSSSLFRLASCKSNQINTAKRRRNAKQSKMGWIGETVESIKSIQIRQALTQAISLGMIVTSALIIWKGLICLTGSESPVVVVLSGSMEPGFKRGDILFLHMSDDPIRVGEIVVFKIEGRDIPIVHRVIKVHERQDTGEVDVLTKGDNNLGDDRLLYAHGQLWLQRNHIMGRAVGFLPYVGYLTIIMTEKPMIKYLLIGALGLLVITSKD